jgi:RimJ/RimL family protein N-acetyltransferase
MPQLRTMRHDIHIDGHAYRLRPVEAADAPLIVGLRTNASLNRYLHASSSRVEDQVQWIAHYHQRSGDYYFVVESRLSHDPEGVVSLYDIDNDSRNGEWGRWILKPGSLAAVESAWLIYRVAFEIIGLQEAFCRTVAANAAVVSFHDSCGIADRRTLAGHFELGGHRHDAIEHRVDRVAWPALDARLSRLAALTARRLARA